MFNAKRIQRKRAAGWRMPPNTVYVGRPTQWGNPFTADDVDDPVAAFRLLVTGKSPFVDEWKDKIELLRGKDLACWCPLDQPCHADVLLELANKEIP